MNTTMAASYISLLASPLFFWAGVIWGRHEARRHGFENGRHHRVHFRRHAE